MCIRDRNRLLTSGNGKSNGSSKSNDNGMLTKVKALIAKTGITTEDLKNLTLSTLLLKIQDQVTEEEDLSLIDYLKRMVKDLGIGQKPAKDIL